MLTSLALIFLVGLAAASLCKRIRLPRMIGMLLTGVLLGPFGWNLLDDSILSISSQLREMALVIILIKAGLSLNVKDLKKVGLHAVLMSFVPAVFEIAAFVLLAPALLGITKIEAAILGAVLGAVSPAVVVPKMVQMMEEGYGSDKGIPQLILAGASLDDVFVIVLFTAFLGIAQGGNISIGDFAQVPVSILSGIGVGILAGLALYAFFETRYAKSHYVRNSMKTIVLLGAAFLLVALETWLKPFVAFSGLLAVMSMACTVQMKSENSVAQRLSEKFGKLWIAAEVILFVLVGAAVDIRFVGEAGLGVFWMILIALVFRSAGVACSLLGTRLNRRERLFCVIAYLPKATVQAAIGGVPLAIGLPCGRLVLCVAVLSIVLTAPLGALGMDYSYQKLVSKSTQPRQS